MVGRVNSRGALFARLFVIAGIVLQSGCKKSAPAVQSPKTTITFVGNDVNPSGMLSQQALDTLATKAGEPTIALVFVRTPLTDAGLQQLESFKNIRRIDAVGSRITAEGIAKLKEAIPEVAVAK